MLDRFVWGEVKRFSPEAPSCPVLDFVHEEKMLGGAGNTSINLAALGAKCVRLVGLAGHDDYGRELDWLLQNGQYVIDNNIVKSKRRTTTKVRFVSNEDSVHLLRYDHEEVTPASSKEIDKILNAVKKWLNVVSGIVIEDYGKGAITPDLVYYLMSLAHAKNIPVFVDPKTDCWELYSNTELVKPNRMEAFAALGLKPGDIPIEEVGGRLLKYTGTKALAITIGKEGIVLFQKDTPEMLQSFPRENVKVLDVSGAGDTVTATLTLARLAGANWKEALDLANTAAGIAVGKKGTASVSSDELLNVWRKNA